MKKINKKQKKLYLILGILLAVIIVSIFGLSNLAIISGGAELACGNAGANKISCSTNNKASIEIPLIAGEKFTTSLNFGDQTSFFNVLCNKLDTMSSGDCTAISNSLGTDSTGSPRTATWRGQVRSKFGEIFIKQIVVMNFTYLNKSLVFYGLCQVDQALCTFTTPVGVETLPKGDALLLSPDSILITLKQGGFTESDFPECSFGEEKCIENNLYSCENYKFVNKGNIDGKCGFELPKTFYHLNNTCNIISILPSQKTSLDYETYADCYLNIKTEDIIISTIENLTGETPTEEEVIEILEEIDYQNITAQENITYLIEESVIAKEESKSILTIFIVGIIIVIALIGLILFLKKRK